MTTLTDVEKLELDSFVSKAAWTRAMAAAVDGLKSNRERGPMPTLVVMSKHGQTVVNDERVARSMSETLSKALQSEVVVLQLISLAITRPASEGDQKPVEGVPS